MKPLSLVGPSRCAALLLTLLPATLLAEDKEDAPLPYSDEEQEQTPRRTLKRDREEEYTRPDREDDTEEPEMMGRRDDPNIGIAGELIGGAMLIDSARGQGAEPRFGWGIRATWEFGRLFGDEAVNDALFADLSWSYAAMRDGTKLIYGDTNLHYFTIAPAYELVFGKGSPYGAFAQVGFGFAYQSTTVHVDKTDTNVAGVKPVFQYGLGFRGRPVIVPAINMRLSFRVEITRFRRSYMDDTFLGGSVGLDF